MKLLGVHVAAHSSETSLKLESGGGALKSARKAHLLLRVLLLLIVELLVGDALAQLLHGESGLSCLALHAKLSLAHLV